MYLEWDNPPPNTTMPEFRAYVQDLHDKIVSVGTGCTHETSVVNQFDFINESISTFENAFAYPSKPLVYKYSSTGNKDLYIKINFYIGGYNGYASRCIYSRVGIWDSLSDCNGNILYSGILNLSYNVNDRPIGIGAVTRGMGRSFISNKDGVLTIFGNHGYTNDLGQDYLKALVNVHVEATPTGFVRLYERNSQQAIYYSTGSISDTANYKPEICAVHNKMATIRRVASTNMSNTDFSAVFPMMYVNVKGELTQLKNTYYYNRVLNNSMGVLPVDGINLWLSGSQLRYSNYLANDNAAIGIEVE